MKKIFFTFLCSLVLFPNTEKIAKAQSISLPGVSSKQYEELKTGLLLDETEQDLVLEYLKEQKNKEEENTEGNQDTEANKEVIQKQLAGGVNAFFDADYKKAFLSLIPLARHGEPKAMELVGIMYRLGQGIDKDPKIGFDWLKKASKYNLPLAQHHLGVMNYTGETGRKDYISALMYLHLAVNYYGNGAAKDQAIRDRDAVSKLLSRLEREKSKQLANSWIIKQQGKK